MSETARVGQEVAAAGDSLLGMAMLGKTAAALALVLAVLLIGAAVLRRWGLPGQRRTRHLRVVASAALGKRERVVIVQVEDTWLVLGVGGGQITRLHSLPADDNDAAVARADAAADRFRTRLTAALGRRAADAGTGTDGQRRGQP